MGWNNARSSLERSQQGGCSKNHSRDVPKPYSTISLILLWLSPQISLAHADPEKSGRTRATPPRNGGPCGPSSSAMFHAPILAPHEESLSSLLIPAGRPGVAPCRAAGITETDP